MRISESIASVLDTCSPPCKDLLIFLHSPAFLVRRVLLTPDRTRRILDDNPDLKKQWTSLIPVGKMGRPEDLMGAVTFLLSEASGYVTGADLRVDGGYTVT